MSRALPRRTLLSLLLLVLLASAWLVRQRHESAVAPGETAPAGRWHTTAPASVEAAAERARLLSLPYAAGRRPAPAGSGVVRSDPARIHAGPRLYTSGHGPEAIVVDRDGRRLRSWRMPFARAFPESASAAELSYFRRAVPLADGGLAAIFQGGGVVRLDARSQLLWAWRGASFNDLWALPDGGLLVLTKEAKRLPEVVPGREVLEDGVTELSPDGRPRRRVSLLAALHDSPFRGLLDPLPEGPDILHANTIEALDGRCAERSPLFSRGHWLVSLREIDTIAVVDPESGRALWAQRGPWRRQHEPSLLPTCRILLFDNLGHGGGSRVLELDPLSGAIVWSWAGETGRPLLSPEAGMAERLPNGNTLIAESEAGRALEITPEGDVVWEFVSPHRAGRANELVATLFEMRTLPPVAEESPR